jgi:hypothetical protein
MVIEELKKIKGPPELMRQTREAMAAGTALPAEAQGLKEAILAREAAKEYRGLIEKYGTLAQIAPLVREKQELLNMAVRDGGLTAEQAAMGMADYLSRFEEFSWIDKMADAFENFGSSVADAFVDGTLTAETFGDALDNLAKQMLKMAINETIMGPLKDLLRGGLSSLVSSFGGGGGLPTMAQGGYGPDIPVSSLHTGGVAGVHGRTRWVSPSVFDNAPRFHSGSLRNNEVAAILERDERVLTRRQTRGLNNLVGGLSQMSGGQVVNNFEVVVPPGSKVTKTEERNSSGGVNLKAMVQSAAAEGAVKPGNPMNKALKTMGTRTPLIGRG